MWHPQLPVECECLENGVGLKSVGVSHACCGLRGDLPWAPAVTNDAELVMLSCCCQLGCALKFLSPKIKPKGEFCFWPSCAGIPLPFPVWGVRLFASPQSRGVYVWEQGL